MKKLLSILAICIGAWLYNGGGIYVTRHEDNSIEKLNILQLFSGESFWFDGVLFMLKKVLPPEPEPVKVDEDEWSAYKGKNPLDQKARR